MSEMSQMAEFAGNLYENYIKQKVEQDFLNHVTYFKANVVTNHGNRKLTVQQPYDNPITVFCTDRMANVTAGTQVLVLRFGKGNAANYIAVAEGDGTSTSEYGQTGSATKGIYLSSSGTPTAMTYSLNANVPANPVLDVTTPSFSSLPVTFYGTGITTNHRLPRNAGIELSNTAVMTSNWQLVTNAGSVTIKRSDSASQTLSASVTASFTLIIPTSTMTLTTTA